MSDTYWNGNGRHQAVYDQLSEHIPPVGEVTDPTRFYLEDLRMASKLYYRFYNDGDKPGEGESGRGEVFRDYHDALVDNLADHIPFMPNSDYYLKQYRTSSTMGLEFPFWWDEQVLEDWIDGVILYCKDKEDALPPLDPAEQEAVYKEQRQQKSKRRRVGKRELASLGVKVQ